MHVIKDAFIYADVLTPILFTVFLLSLTILPLSLMKLEMIYFYNYYNLQPIYIIGSLV